MVFATFVVLTPRAIRILVVLLNNFSSRTSHLQEENTKLEDEVTVLHNNFLIINIIKICQYNLA